MNDYVDAKNTERMHGNCYEATAMINAFRQSWIDSNACARTTLKQASLHNFVSFVEYLLEWKIKRRRFLNILERI